MSRLQYLLVLFFISIGAYSQASTTRHFSPSEDELNQRTLYLQAIGHLRHGRNLEYVQAKHKLKHYPLYSYMEYDEIATPLRYWNRKKILGFIEKYQDQPISDYLYRRWLDYLIRGDRWQAYLIDYKGSDNTSRQCYHALAQYRNKQKTDAFKAGIALWQVGYSQPKGCDKLFAVLQANKVITEDIAWQRFLAAYPTRNSKLLRYLGRFFNTDTYQQRYKRYMSLRAKPHLLARYFNFDDVSDANMAALVYVLKRWGTTDAERAEQYWQTLHNTLDIPPQQAQLITASIVRGLIKHDAITKADTLLEQLQHYEPDLLEWRLRQALEAQDWHRVKHWISNLPSEQQLSQRWRYWLARAETATTKGAELKQHRLIIELAQERGFYSFLAADAIGAEYAFEYEATVLDAATINAIKQNPGLARARELHAIGKPIEATREWYAATQAFSKSEWEASAIAFHEWEWPYLAILSMTKAQSWQDIVVRFPVLYETDYRREAEAQQLPPSLLMAITRQESAFNEKAISSANAHGLMQLLPSTAKYIAKKQNINYNNRRKLLEPAKNIELGSAYYRYLMDQFNNNRPLSIASYNAGPTRVNQWLKKSDEPLPMDIWIETIPFKETRRYVQNVLSFSVIYARHLGEQSPILFESEQVATRH